MVWVVAKSMLMITVKISAVNHLDRDDDIDVHYPDSSDDDGDYNAATRITIIITIAVRWY